MADVAGPSDVAAAPGSPALRIVAADTALVQSVEVLSLASAEPVRWGRMAAVAALTPLDATGARPVGAVEVASLASGSDESVLVGARQGAAEVLGERGIGLDPSVGRDDPVETTFGVAVHGVVDPARAMSPGAARAGDVLVLTAALGGGVAEMAMAADCCPGPLRAVAVEAAGTSEGVTASEAVAAGVRAAVAVGRWGLLGHLEVMAGASRVRAVVDSAALPLLDGVDTMVRWRFLSNSTRRNGDLARGSGVDVGDVPDHVAWLAVDSRPAGGIVFAVDPTAVESLLVSLALKGRRAWRIGHVEGALPGRPTVSLR